MTDAHHRRHDALLAALDLLVEHWGGAHFPPKPQGVGPVSYTHLRAHET